MRCEDCLPLVEEYADGEVDEMTGRMMSAHLAACADCSDALDALRFEQELFARYERPVEVTPALWQRVRAGINVAEPAPPPTPQSATFFERLREALAAALGSLAARPALASGLAVAVVALASGAVWLSMGERRATPQQVAGDANATRRVAPARAAEAGGNQEGIISEARPAVVEVVRKYPIDADPRRAAHQARFTNAAVTTTTLPGGTGDVVTIPEDHHAVAGDDAALMAELPQAEIAAGLVTDARQPAPEEKEVARHVEQAQMLLRSFKNAEPADLSYEKGVSQRLLEVNAALKVGAEVSGDKDTRQVLNAIEPFLLDIKNLRDKPSREEVRSIKERMQKNEIIAALQVY